MKVTSRLVSMPLDLDLELMVDDLIATARETVPVGAHTHDRGVNYTQWNGRGQASLRTQIGSKGNWTWKSKGVGMYAQAVLHHWGAGMLEFGANVAAVTKKFMHWNQPGTGIKQRWARRGFIVQPRPFSDDILRRFMARAGINRGGVRVSWKKGRTKTYG